MRWLKITPNIEARVVGAQFLEIRSIDGKQTARHGWRSKRQISLGEIRDLNLLPDRIDSPGSGFPVTFRNAVPIELQTPVEAADVREVGLENV